MDPTFKYYAFISYSSHDTAWGKRLQRKLENYRMPTTLCSRHGWERKPMKPVFFAPTDIQPGGLSEELQERLRDSRHLIVICSPHSAQSRWVGKEIAYFHSLGRADNILFFIVNGIPHSGNTATECFNPVIEELGLPEILGANVNEKIYRWPWLNRERAYVQLITKLLGVEFDTIWRRHRRLMLERAAGWTTGILILLTTLSYIWAVNRPIDVNIRLEEQSAHNNRLPQLKDAIVTLNLDNETKTDTICTLNDHITFTNIPHRFLGKNVHLTVTCKDFLKTDTTLLLSKDIQLNIYRDAEVYGRIKFGIWDSNMEKFITGVGVQINGYSSFTDNDGIISLTIPLEEQQTTYKVTADIPLINDSIYMPCGYNDVLLTK